MKELEARELKKCVKRLPIDEGTIQHLLSASNYVCSVCRGSKGTSYVIHHIVPYEETQNNDYNNLIVLCPNDHDQAHQGGLSMRITSKQLLKEKEKWQREVERVNVQRASRALDVDGGSIDYVNAQRIEEACTHFFGCIPDTNYSDALKDRGILSQEGLFDEPFVRKHMSGGKYLFNYLSTGETRHYKELMQRISDNVDFFDLDDNLNATALKSKELEGQFAFFIGGVTAKRDPWKNGPIREMIEVKYKRQNFHIQWVVDSDYLVSSTSHARLSGKVRYIIYCQIKSIAQNRFTRQWTIKATPLLIAPPRHFINKKPIIAYVKEQEREEMEDEEFDVFDTTEFTEDFDDNEFK